MMTYEEYDELTGIMLDREWDHVLATGERLYSDEDWAEWQALDERLTRTFEVIAAGYEDPRTIRNHSLERLRIARWRHQAGQQLSFDDLQALAWAADAVLAGKLPAKPRGRPQQPLSPREKRKRQLLAKHLRDQGHPLEIVAAMMGTGIEARHINDLVAGAATLAEHIPIGLDLDDELMAEIRADYKTR